MALTGHLQRLKRLSISARHHGWATFPCRKFCNSTSTNFFLNSTRQWGGRCNPRWKGNRHVWSNHKRITFYFLWQVHPPLTSGHHRYRSLIVEVGFNWDNVSTWVVFDLIVASALSFARGQTVSFIFGLVLIIRFCWCYVGVGLNQKVTGSNRAVPAPASEAAGATDVACSV